MLYPHKIVAVDLRGVSLEDLEYWFLTTDAVTSEVSKNMLRIYVDTTCEEEEQPRVIYFVNDFWFVHSTNKSYPEIQFDEYYISELNHLQPIPIEEMALYRSVLIEWFYRLNKKNYEIFNAVIPLQKEIDDEEIFCVNFLNSMACIDVLNLGITLRDLFMPLNEKFKEIHQFFAVTYAKKQLLNKVYVSKIYLFDGFILGYNLVLEGETQEHYFMNFFVEEELQGMPRMKIAGIKGLDTNEILDKINRVGLENLSPEERDFLNNLK